MLRCIVMGAAGRDFHDFLTFFKGRDDFRVVAFTAAQIPFIAERTFPRSLAGPQYAADLPIAPESELPRLIRELEVDFVFLAYSDLSHTEVMHKASLVQSCGAAFAMLGPKQTQLASQRPVVSVTAVRTGAGKSPLTRALAVHLRGQGWKVAALRHPMPYGELSRQRVQRFATEADLELAECTVEEREEYEPYLEAGLVVFAGVDYRAVLVEAEAQAEVLLWDGGNNDYPFLRPDFSLVLADALRPGHEDAWYPGETNLRAADVVLINKVSQAPAEAVARIERTVARLAPRAVVLHSDLVVSAAPPHVIEGRRVLVVEDGPSVTHGGLGHGAGLIAAREGGAREIIDPRPFALGTLAQAYRDFPHLGPVLPALGYSAAQRHELEETIARSGAEVLVDASPARLDRALSLALAVARVSYGFEQRTGPSVFALVDEALSQWRPT